MTPRPTHPAFAPVLALVGLLAGVAAWGLAEVGRQAVLEDRSLLGIAAAVGAVFAAALAAAGPLRIGQAVVAGCLVALPAASLLWGASFRFDDVGRFLNAGYPLVAYAAVLALGLPFAIALLRFDQDPTNYSALFENAWGLVTRGVTALAFLALFWAAIFLGDALLQLVDIGWIKDLLAHDAAPFVLNGLCTGLALAVAHRVSGLIGPDLPIALLRLLLPIVTAITVVFLGAVAVRGGVARGELFRTVSAAATLMAVGALATALIAAALERGGLWAVKAPAMRWATGLLALMLPVLGALAATAVNLRVAQYGWTPDRLAAATGAVLLCGYGATHAVAVLARRNWMQRIRQGNVLMAAAALSAAAIWLNPFLAPEKIAADSLAARLAAAPQTVTDRDLRLLAYDYGRAGQAALTAIAAGPEAPLSSRAAALLADIAARKADSPGRPNAAARKAGTGLGAAERAWHLAQIAVALTPLPPEATLPQQRLEALEDTQLRDLAAGCQRRTPAGHSGCAVVLADLLPEAEGIEALFVHLTPEGGLTVFAQPAEGGAPLRLTAVQEGWPSDPAVLDRLRGAPVPVVPLALNGLRLGDHVLFALP